MFTFVAFVKGCLGFCVVKCTLYNLVYSLIAVKILAGKTVCEMNYSPTVSAM